jgi:integral membrane protein
MVIKRSLLLQYRVLAFTTAILLIVLVFVGIPLQVAAGRPGVVNVVGTMHGILYLVYLVVAFRLTWALKIPIWQMLLVLLAGTVPFCAFVAERKMTKRFDAVAGILEPRPSRRRSRPTEARTPEPRSGARRRRWVSRRALLLHAEVAIVAPGCAVAGWWQATRALAGNSLSWFYSVEWPVFALLAVWGWWHLIHEDPAEYRLRRIRAPGDNSLVEGHAAMDAAGIAADATPTRVDSITARRTRMFAASVTLELVLGLISVFFVPYDRPTGWVPAKGAPIYLAHALFGIFLVYGSAALVFRFRASERAVQLCTWLGCASVMFAGVGGILTEARSLVRFLGMALMFLGSAFAIFFYMIPSMMRSSRAASRARELSAGGPA